MFIKIQFFIGVLIHIFFQNNYAMTVILFISKEIYTYMKHWCSINTCDLWFSSVTKNSQISKRDCLELHLKHLQVHIHVINANQENLCEFVSVVLTCEKHLTSMRTCWSAKPLYCNFISTVHLILMSVLIMVIWWFTAISHKNKANKTFSYKMKLK